MTELLLRLFVKTPGDWSAPKARGAVGILSGCVGIACNLLLSLSKLIIGRVTGSVSITADALNNLSDASGSVVTLIGFRAAEKPADTAHPFGHARAEYLSALAVSALILVIGLELAKSSLEKILHPAPVNFTAAAAGVLLLSIAVKLWMCLFNRRLAAKIDSDALRATAADSRNDCLTTAAVLLASLLEKFLNLRADGFFGLGVSAFILYSGFGLAKGTVSTLLGENADPALQAQIVDYVSACPKVLGFHDLMVHDYGPGQRFATLHVEMDAREDPLLCHELIDDMERECLRSHSVHLVIHYDPVVTDDAQQQALKARAQALLQEYDPRLTLHDFRMTRGEDFDTLAFDVAVPDDLQAGEQALTAWLEERMNRAGERAYRINITFDPLEFFPQGELGGAL